MPVITVSQINKYIGSILKSNRNLQGIMVKGEVSNFSCHYKSGHCYFSLKDSDCILKSVIFSSVVSRLRFQPEDGMEVIVSGSISVYERDGAYQLYVNDIIPAGAGKESTALERLKRKLAAEGIFDERHKRKPPYMPKKIGVVTSLSGAAIHDIITVLTRRYPLCELYAVDSTVQGKFAPQSICSGIMQAESAGCDVIIVGRGGGPSENLSAFDTEAVARAVYNCKVPVISAVGHEIDFSITDMAADLRVPTPSAAAELASPDIRQLAEMTDNLIFRAERAALNCIDRKISAYAETSARLAAQSPENRLKLMEEKIGGLINRAEAAVNRRINGKDADIREIAGRLDSLSPLKVMARGYSLVYSGEKLVRDSADISNGQRVEIRFHNGGAEAEIKKIW